MSKKIVFNITHGFQARMLLRSGIAARLISRGSKIIIISKNFDEEYFKKEFSDPRFVLEKMPIKISRTESILVNFRQYLLMNPTLGATLNLKNEIFKKERPILSKCVRCANIFLGRFSLLRVLYIKIESILFSGREFDDILNRNRPDLVVTGTPGMHPLDIHLLRSAQRKKLKTATVMLSWDNLTSKGYMGAKPDFLLVWSDLMAVEAAHYHSFPQERIVWSGAAQFDVYHKISDLVNPREWRKIKAVPVDRPLIVYGTVNPALVPHEINIIKSIIESFNSNSFKIKPFLWVRLHPQVVRGEYSQSLKPYRNLACEDVYIEEPPVLSDKLDWDLPKSDSLHLAQLISAADVVVTTSSTLSIDAACAGTPIINVFFDGDNPIPKEYSIKRFMHYTHNAKLLDSGGIGKAYTIKDFVELVHSAISDSTKWKSRLGNIIRQQINVLDGRSGERTADILISLA